MSDRINIFIGYDRRESATYHVLCQSILETTTSPVSIMPLHGPMLSNFDGQQDGTNAFIYSRFLIPDLMGFKGWALYLDSDMLVRTDLSELWAMRDQEKAVMVCKHDYKTRTSRKFIKTPMEARNEHYPRKNWSSLILWNCGHPRNSIVTRDYAATAGGHVLHRFSWLSDDLIGEIPLSWNHLVGEYAYSSDTNLAHYTLGAPGFRYYQGADYAHEWHEMLCEVNRMEGEEPLDMIARAS